MRLLSTSTIANELLSTRATTNYIAKHKNNDRRGCSAQDNANEAAKKENDGK